MSFNINYKSRLYFAENGENRVFIWFYNPN